MLVLLTEFTNDLLPITFTTIHTILKYHQNRVRKVEVSMDRNSWPLTRWRCRQQAVDGTGRTQGTAQHCRLWRYHRAEER